MKISLIVPVYNEEETIPIFYSTIRSFPAFENLDVEIIFINDGSQDNTPDLIHALSIADSSIIALHFMRNFGKEAALMAGLEHCSGDVVIPIDVDLQDPINIIPLMIEKWLAGADIVLAKRCDRSSDSFIKRTTAFLFYKLHNKISDLQIEENVGDFRLISKNIVENIKKMPEINLFMKGILSWTGGKVDIIEYTRAARIAGHTKFNGWKLWNLALEGITSFSTVPLRIWTYIGSCIALLAFIYGLWMITSTLMWGNPVKGYPSLLVSILFLGGIQLMGIGILGEYIGRIYMESKKRPRYILKDLNDNAHK